MPDFTMELRDVIDILEVEGGSLGLDDYPIFDEIYREGLNAKIINHFWYREIGQETIAQFTRMLRRKMHEIMPLYNQMYKSQLLDVDPFLTFRSKTDDTSRTSSESDNSATVAAVTGATTESKTLAYPQTAIIDGQEYADTGAGSTTDGTSDTSTQSRDSGTTEGSASSTSEGFSGSMSNALLEYRETFLNIDMEVIAELEELFMGVLVNGEQYTQKEWDLW